MDLKQATGQAPYVIYFSIKGLAKPNQPSRSKNYHIEHKIQDSDDQQVHQPYQ